MRTILRCPKWQASLKCPGHLARDVSAEGAARIGHSVAGRQNARILRERLGADGEDPGRHLRAMARKITWWQAAEIIGISDRSMRRWKVRYDESGYKNRTS